MPRSARAASLNGAPGNELFLGQAGVAGAAGKGIGGGLLRFSNANPTLANTNINGNSASSSGNDVGFADVLE